MSREKEYGIRLKKLEELKKLGINPYPHKFEATTTIKALKDLYEKTPKGEEVIIRGTIKRISNYEGKKLLRITDETGLEILVLMTPDNWELKPGETYNFKGCVHRLEGKLTITDAQLTQEEPTTSIKEIKDKYDLPPKEEELSLAGRIITLRPMGKAIFGHIQDLLGKIQIYIRKDNAGEENFKFIKKYIDVGDIVGVKGKLFRTQTGELTVEVKELKLLSKCLHPLPEKWHGIKDVEVRYRQRYLDLIANPKAREIFLMRSKLISAIREFMNKYGFIEVETPILQPIASGANAKPFVTYHNYLEQNLYLRIAPELYLKRLIVGGFPKVFEIGKNFRNEGVDTTHNPEFTMMEAYEAYGDYASMMDLTEAVLVAAAEAAGAPETFTWMGHEVSLKPPFPRKRYDDLLAEVTGCDPLDPASVANEATKHDIETAGRHPDVIKSELFEATVEKTLSGPIFVIDYPAAVCPLTKRNIDDDTLSHRWELFVGGMEIANAYTELNDPDLQEELFKTQLAGLSDDESMARMDHDFIKSLRHGMPPAGGLGIGIDRLVMFLTQASSIRDIILFPIHRPHSGG